jgi:hypothetical protein
VVEQSGEPFLLSCLCYFAHTAQSLGHSFPALYGRAYGPRNFMKKIASGAAEWERWAAARPTTQWTG